MRIKKTTACIKKGGNPKKDREFIALRTNLLKGIIARNPGKYNYDLS